MTIFIVLVVIAGAMAMLLPELPRGRAQRSDVDALTVKVAEQKKLLARQKQEVHWLQTNPEYLEIYARDRLEMMKEGETVFRMEGESK